jgi:hypothetical protein
MSYDIEPNEILRCTAHLFSPTLASSPMRQAIRFSTVLAPSFVVSNVGAQDTIPVRSIGPILATSAENVGPDVSIQGAPV